MLAVKMRIYKKEIIKKKKSLLGGLGWEIFGFNGFLNL